MLVMTIREALMGPELKDLCSVAGGSMPHYAVFPECLLIPSLHPSESTLSLQSAGKQRVPGTSYVTPSLSRIPTEPRTVEFLLLFVRR